MLLGSAPMRTFLASSLALALTSCAADHAGMEVEPDPMPDAMPPPEMDAAPTPAVHVTVAATHVRVIRNGIVSLGVVVSRSGGATGDIEVSMDDLPVGVTASGVTIPDGMTTGTIELSGNASVELGTFATATVRATSGALEASQPVELHLTDVPGAKDLSFGTGGKVFGGYASQHDEKVRFVATQADGKIVVCGEDETSKMVFVARYLPDGALDDSFGTGGIRTIGNGVTALSPLAVGVTPDGVVRVVVREGAATFVYAYASGGKLDTSYGSSGAFGLSKATTGSDFSAGSATVAADGSVVLAETGSGSFGVARITPQGALDTAFDGDGKASGSFGSGVNYPKAVTVRPDGRIVVSGSHLGGAYTSYAVAQLTAAGGMDTSFSDDGKWTLDVGATTSFSVAAVLADGRLAVLDPYSATPQIFMFTPSGHVDLGFGTQGKLALSLTTARHLIAVEDGLITVGAAYDSAIEKRHLDGTLDMSFGASGLAVIDFAVATEYPQSAAIDAQGRVVITSFATAGLELNQIGVARIWN